MKAQILKVGIVSDMIGHMVGRAPARVQTYLFLPEQKIAVTAVDEIFIAVRDFTPHSKMRITGEIEVSHEMVALIQNWAISQAAVEQALKTKPEFEKDFAQDVW